MIAEAATPRILDWLARQEPGKLAISEWTATELSSALSLKCRTGQITADYRNEALAVFRRLRAASLTVLPIEAGCFRTAGHMVDDSALGLRAADALHLAVAAEHGAQLATLDERLAACAEAAGVSILRP